MANGKELLLSCIVMMHVYFMASRPTKATLQDCLKEQVMVLARCNLKKAEQNYVKLMFKGNPPAEYNSTSLELPRGELEGITFIGTKEVQASSICAISDYLDKHLPAIVGNLTKEHKDILKHTRAFLNVFNTAVKDQNEGSKKCPREITTSDDYAEKEKGLQMIYFTRRWVEIFTGTNTTCTLKA